MVNMNGNLIFSTSCMNPETDHESRGLIPQSAELEYGAVHRLSHAHEVGGRLTLSGAGATTTLMFTVTDTEMVIKQDGVVVGSKALKAALVLPKSAALEATSCVGIYGACPPSTNVTVTVTRT